VTPREFRERLRKRARRVDVSVPANVAEKLESYVRLLARWNEKINLTALNVANPDDHAIDRLLIEPLIAASLLHPAQVSAIVDLGSGSGSPAIPIAIASGIPVRMVESKVRKAAFLSEAIRQLELTGSSVETSRYEQLLTRPELHEAADVVTIRAVRMDSRTLLTVQAFLRSGGRLFLFRGGTLSGEPSVPPPMRWVQTLPLATADAGQLVVLAKDLIAGR
jgi:16S rRNA (guanine527-N7)-methyltransferase